MTNWQPGNEWPQETGSQAPGPAQWNERGLPEWTGPRRDVQPYQSRPASQYQAPAQPPQQFGRARKVAMTGAEGFWYILQCIAFGAGYFAKVPAKKALQDWGLAKMTAAENFWYVLMCISFGAGYFAKLPVSRALSEMQHQGGYH